jgi:hypothetical protein
MLEGPVLYHFEEPLQPGDDLIGGFPELQGQRRIEQVAGGQTEVDPSPRISDRLRRRPDERGHVMLRGALELLDAGGRHGGPLPDRTHVLLGDPTEAGPRLTRQHLDP